MGAQQLAHQGRIDRARGDEAAAAAALVRGQGRVEVREGLVLAAFDPCASGSDANSAAAGWPVRNLLALAAARF